MSKNVSEMWYRGVVKNVPNGFGFIDRTTVVMINGLPHDIDMDTDIFIPQSECEIPLEVGLAVRFQIEPNPEKGERAFKAVRASAYTESTELVPSEGPVMPGFTWNLVPGKETKTLALTVNGKRDPHAKMKDVDPVKLEKVRENKPLEGVPPENTDISMPENPEAIRRILEEYLYNLFPGLANLEGFDFSVIGFHAEKLDALMAENAKSLEAMNMSAQVQTLNEEYERFKHTRKLLEWIMTKGMLQPGTKLSPATLNGLVKLVEETGIVQAKGQTVHNAIQVVDFLNERGLLRPNATIDIKYLPDLFMAVPVWFILFQNKDEQNDTMRRWEDAAFGGITEGLRYFMDLVPTQSWASTFLTFNRRLRGLPLYKGDIIPSRVMAFMKEASAVFDYVVIMTPYLDHACLEWQDPEWVNGLDPYVVGFKQGLPYMFMLARFSDTGIFPLHDKLTADTVDFLERNTQKLQGFNIKKHKERPGLREQVITWVSVTKEGKREEAKVEDAGDRFMANARDLLTAFDHGHLFDWLRGEWQVPELVLKGGNTAGELPADASGNNGEDGDELTVRTIEAEVIDPDDDDGDDAVDVTPEGDGQ